METLYKLLVVDDDSMSGELMCRRLEKRGYKTTLESDPRKVEDVVKEYKPDLILLDIVMPYLSGIEVLELLRQKNRSIELPIIMMTGKTDDSQIVTALNLGANDYIGKPIHIDIAMARISAQLEMVHVNRDSLHLKEMETIHSMVTTYNHEINNPLAIAYGHLSKDFSAITESDIKKVFKAIKRISTIVKKIDEITDADSLECKDYVSGTNMVDIDSY